MMSDSSPPHFVCRSNFRLSSVLRVLLILSFFTRHISVLDNSNDICHLEEFHRFLIFDVATVQLYILIYNYKVNGFYFEYNLIMTCKNVLFPRRWISRNSVSFFSFVPSRSFTVLNFILSIIDMTNFFCSSSSCNLCLLLPPLFDLDPHNLCSHFVTDPLLRLTYLFLLHETLYHLIAWIKDLSTVADLSTLIHSVTRDKICTERKSQFSVSYSSFFPERKFILIFTVFHHSFFQALLRQAPVLTVRYHNAGDITRHPHTLLFENESLASVYVCIIESILRYSLKFHLSVLSALPFYHVRDDGTFLQTTKLITSKVPTLISFDCTYEQELIHHRNSVQTLDSSRHTSK